MIRMYMVGAILVALLLLIVSQMYLRPSAPVSAEGLTNLVSCPAGLKEYTTNNAVNCCEGEVLGGKCQGTPKCTLSAKSDGLPQCADYYRAHISAMSRRYCPRSMPHYYEIDGRGYCTSAQLKSDGSGPLDAAGAKFCDILATPEERLSNPKSCLNVRRLDEMKVTTSEGESVTKNIMNIQGQKIGAPIILYAIIAKDLQARLCYDRNSLEINYDYVEPQWRSDPQVQQQLARVTFCA